MSSSLLSVNPLPAAGRANVANQFVNPKSISFGSCFCKFKDRNVLRGVRIGCRKVGRASVLVVRSSSAESGQMGPTKAVEELNKILSFNNLLVSLKNHPDSDSLPRGIGPVSLRGEEYDTGGRVDDLKLLFRTYVTYSLSEGIMNDDKLEALNQLRNIFGLGKREAEAIIMDVTSKVYRKRLGQAVYGGQLEAADSKAAYLQNLCKELNFDPKKASEIHEEIYRTKLQQLVSDGELSDDDVKALLRLRVILCVPQCVVEAAHADICGSLFEKVVRDAIASGVDGYDSDVKKSVRKAVHGLRLTREAAISVASKAVKRIFLNYVKRAMSLGNCIEAAKELKKMLSFNTLVVIELVADIKGESTDTLPEEPVREEITLKDDLPERDRLDLYKTYLLFGLPGDGKVTEILFGTQITTIKDDSEYILLNQLGKILGLTPKEIVEVHRSLAEQAFRKQAEVILADGQLTKARIEQLDEAQKQVGLPPEYAQKIIKSIITFTPTKMAAAIETAIGQGKLNIKELRELKKANVNVDNMISESLRENLFKKTVDEIFSSGTGEFDEEEVYQKIPADLNINTEKAKVVVQELAKTRLSNSLIQAVSSLRQKNHSAVVSALNDLLACDKAVPSEPLSWDVPEEISDLFAVYIKNNPGLEKASRLQHLLGTSDETAASLREMSDLPLPRGPEEEFEF